MKYDATVKITRLTDGVTDRYGKTEKSPEFSTLLEIGLTATTLAKLQEKIIAHVQLVED